MNTLTLHSDKSNFYSIILRFCAGAIGLFYLINSGTEYLATYNFTTGVVVNGIFGFGILLVVFFNPTFGANIELNLNPEFMRIKEDLSFIRTAYWDRIDTLTLTRFSIRIKYKSGTPERFRLPYLRGNDHDDLREWLQTISTKNDIRFSEKAWWKPF